MLTSLPAMHRRRVRARAVRVMLAADSVDRQGKATMADRNAPSGNAREASMDATDLWREEIITDRKIGTLRVMTPIRPDGQFDPARQTTYVGEAQMMTNMGALPISFEIEATSLADAVAGYGRAAAEAFDRTMKELQELRRQSASSLVLPGQGGGGFGPGGLPPGLGGGGKLQMP
jgi:hypothetical protein